MRRTLAGTGLLVLVVAAASVLHGVRLPPLHWEPAPRPAAADSPRGYRVEAEGARLVAMRGDVPVFRAFTPEPALRFESPRAQTAEAVLQNVHPEATADAEGQVELTAEHTTRRVRADLGPARSAAVAFRFPQRARYTFAAIGDTGGLAALRFCIERAHELGADFLLHLGDIGYSENAFHEAAVALEAAPIPTFASIGNHDLEGPWTDPSAHFTRVAGPRNTLFTLAGVTFANLDTSSDLFLPMRGQRATLLRELEARRAGVSPGPLIIFTHKPLSDPRVIAGERSREDAHALDRGWESSWLRRKLLDLGAQALLAGHIHESYAFDDGGLPTYVSGEGLALPDLVSGKQISRIVVGSWRPGEAVELRWEPLQFPPELLIPH